MCASLIGSGQIFCTPFPPPNSKGIRWSYSCFPIPYVQLYSVLTCARSAAVRLTRTVFVYPDTQMIFGSFESVSLGVNCGSGNVTGSTASGLLLGVGSIDGTAVCVGLPHLTIKMITAD